MEGKYPHWYHDHDMECCDYPDKDMVCCDDMPHRPYPAETLKDRIMCLLGDEVLFSVDARICHRESFCGTLCYVGCDFIVVNVCLNRKSISLHVPIKMLRFIAPYKSRGRVF